MGTWRLKQNVTQAMWLNKIHITGDIKLYGSGCKNIDFRQKFD